MPTDGLWSEFWLHFFSFHNSGFQNSDFQNSYLRIQVISFKFKLHITQIKKFQSLVSKIFI